MEGKIFQWCIYGLAALTSALWLGSPARARAGEPPLTEHLNGLINDYSPASVGGGPYEIRGEWSLELNHGSVTADFSAAVNMETSDWGISKGTVDPSDPTTRGAHTHHITLSHATVSNDWSVCPAFNPPVTAGFVVTGTASVTGNGSPAPFEANGNPPSTLQVCVTGGSQVAFSNITLVFSGPATKHFGTCPGDHDAARRLPTDHAKQQTETGSGRPNRQSSTTGCVGNGTIVPHGDLAFDVYDVQLTIDGCADPYTYLNTTFEGLSAWESYPWDYSGGSPFFWLWSVATDSASVALTFAADSAN